ncbi:HEAT repeat domain-containing protein [Streptomyces sp. TE12347]
MPRFDMDDELTPYLQGSTSASWSVRAASGRRLAAVAEIPEVAEVLRRLLLDGRDTFVTQETAEALLGRWDVLGLRMVLAALARANDDTGDHLHAAILNVCGQSAEDGERLAALCSALASDADDAVSGEARRILEPPRSPDLYRP